jgi:uncharacterized membrane protein
LHTTDQAHRVIFIDLMRAIAVLQMVQGHTISVFLSKELQTTELPLFAIWYFLRGMTAPIFMFTAGTVFTYLFRSVKRPFKQNYRVKKGIRRAFLLIFFGYVLRYPTWKVIDFSEVTPEQWQAFITVDVLQLIGVSLLILLLILFITEKLKQKFTLNFALSAAFIFLISPFTELINWNSFLPAPVAAYFYSGIGSLFPLIPWAGYVIAGGVLGSYLAENPLVFKTAEFSIKVGIYGIAFVAIAFLSQHLIATYNIQIINPQTEPNTILFRMGFVLILTAIVSYISLSLNRIPLLIILAGRNTLLIYVVHLVILFGSAWTPGLDLLWGSSFSGWLSFLAALFMITLMTFMVLLIHMLKIHNKELVT